MFDRFIRLQRARKALREQRFEDALQLADDPEIRAHKRAENIRDKAREELLSRAARRVSDGDLRAARAIYKRLEALADDERVRALGADLAAGEVSAREATEAARKGLDEANRLMQAGDVGAAAAAVAALPRGSLAIECQRLEQQLADRSRQAMEQLARAQELLQADDVTGAQKAFARAATLDRVAAAEARVRPRLSKACAAHASANIEKHIATARGTSTKCFPRWTVTCSLYGRRLGPGVHDPKASEDKKDRPINWHLGPLDYETGWLKIRQKGADGLYAFNNPRGWISLRRLGHLDEVAQRVSAGQVHGIVEGPVVEFVD